MNYVVMTTDRLPDAQRARWISILSLADPAALETYWARLHLTPTYRWLRPAETGLVMLQGCAGGNGQPFNLGEMTATRAVAVLDGDRPLSGFGYVAGRNKRHAELAALFDALLQDDQHHAVLWRELIEPIEAAHHARHDYRAAAVAATRVDFTTMVRGDV
jgi:alpha-D-ribose 1-methylphosphonate 5-triphosphate synthase subunit PhnG